MTVLRRTVRHAVAATAIACVLVAAESNLSDAHAKAAPAQAEPAADTAADWPQPLKTALLDALDASRPLDATLIETLRMTTDDAPVTLGAPPRLERDGDDTMTVTLTNIVMGEPDEGTAEIDRMSMTMKRVDDTHVAVDVQMSPEMRFDDGILRMDEPAISGVYNTELETYSTFDAVVTNLRAAEYLFGPDGPTGEKEAFRLDKFSFTQAFDDSQPKLTSDATITAEGLIVLPLGPKAEKTDNFTLERAVFTASMNDVDRNGYMAFVDLMELSSEDDSGVSGQQLAAVLGNMDWTGFGMEGRLEGAHVMMDGVPLAQSGVVGIDFSGDNDGGTGDVNLGLTIDEAGFTDAGWAKLQEAEAEARMFPRDVVFTDLDLSLTLKAVPYTGLMRAALSSESGADQRIATQAVAEAGTHLTIDELRLEAPKARIDGSGAVTSLGVAAPPAANGVLTVDGLDLFIDHVKATKEAEHMQKQIMPLLMVVKGMGKQPDDPGATGLVYNLDFSLENGFTINDMPFESLMGGR